MNVGQKGQETAKFATLELLGIGHSNESEVSGSRHYLAVGN